MRARSRGAGPGGRQGVGGGASGGPRALAELVSDSAIDVFDLSRAPELREAAALMERSADTPMDFADATLLLLAEALDVQHVLTLDRRGFAVYRTRQNRALGNVLDVERDETS